MMIIMNTDQNLQMKKTKKIKKIKGQTKLT
jgi:hypothetical protein